MQRILIFGIDPPICDWAETIARLEGGVNFVPQRKVLIDMATFEIFFWAVIQEYISKEIFWFLH